MKQKTIVVIDDDLDDLDIMSDVIATVEPEANCVIFKDPQTAVDELLSNPSLFPDYIFIDYNMPVMRGDECLEKLRKCERLNESVIVMISTSMPELTTSKLYDAGANYAVEKPSRLSNYYTLFKSIFRNHR
jgi:CheY-like chemotaxis protein